uniref:Uncharacterized protein n=1 Tax=Helianthus annuus TaxID=4232 RepID=A0A251U733_HELAN
MWQLIFLSLGGNSQMASTITILTQRRRDPFMIRVRHLSVRIYYKNLIKIIISIPDISLKP